MKARTAPLVAVLVTLILAASACSGAPDSRADDGPQSVGAAPSKARLSAARVGGRSIVFGAAGDLGANARTARTLAMLDRSAAAFFLALGDLDYDETASDAAWCDYVHRRLPTKGASFPFEILVGNHEEDGGPDGRLRNFAACLPDRLSAGVGPGRYGAEYAFKYPAADPLVKVISISPKLTVDGVTYGYGPGTAHRRWLVRQIRRARTAGIPWVVVAMHFPCISMGPHGCDSGKAIMNLLVRKRVDLVVTGHQHLYERSKQLRLNADRCPAIRQPGYDAGCVVDRGRDGLYRKGRGTVFITSGMVGGNPYHINRGDADAGYFAAWDDTSSGWLRYRVSETALTGRFMAATGSYRDAFTISKP